MSKEQTLVEAIVVESNEVAIQTELTMLDDLSLDTTTIVSTSVCSLLMVIS